MICLPLFLAGGGDTNTLRAEKMRCLRSHLRQMQRPDCYLASRFSQRLVYFCQCYPYSYPIMSVAKYTDPCSSEKQRIMEDIRCGTKPFVQQKYVRRGKTQTLSTCLWINVYRKLEELNHLGPKAIWISLHEVMYTSQLTVKVDSYDFYLDTSWVISGANLVLPSKAKMNFGSVLQRRFSCLMIFIWSGENRLKI